VSRFIAVMEVGLLVCLADYRTWHHQRYCWQVVFMAQRATASLAVKCRHCWQVV